MITTEQRLPPAILVERNIFTDFVVCSAPLPFNLTSAEVEGRVIPASIPSEVEKIALLSDTGCRTVEWQIQHCRDKDQWPLELISQQIAVASPNIILHPGDYYYREGACPPGNETICGGSAAPIPGMPFNDSPLGWWQDVFWPMSHLFPVAPIAFLIGNHESCSNVAPRGGVGFYLYLDPRPDTTEICSPVLSPDGQLMMKTEQETLTETWGFELPVKGGRLLKVAMVNSNGGNDQNITDYWKLQVPSYTEAAQYATDASGSEAWLMTHRNIFGIVVDQFIPYNVDPNAQAWTSNQEILGSYGQLDNFDMIASSHVHFLQVVQIPGQPGLMIVGNGGTLLDQGNLTIPKYPPLTNSLDQPLVPGVGPYNETASFLWTVFKHGYAIAVPVTERGSWVIDQYDYKGDVFGVCTLQNRTLACEERTTS